MFACNISRYTRISEILRCLLIILDEFKMVYNRTVEAVNKSFRDVPTEDTLTEYVSAVLSGDLKKNYGYLEENEI